MSTAVQWQPRTRTQIPTPRAWLSSWWRSTLESCARSDCAHALRPGSLPGDEEQPAKLHEEQLFIQWAGMPHPWAHQCPLAAHSNAPPAAPLQNLIAALLGHGVQTFPELLRTSGLPVGQLKSALLVMIQHNCVNCYLHEEPPTLRGPGPSYQLYEAATDRILQIVRCAGRAQGTLGLRGVCLGCHAGASDGQQGDPPDGSAAV